MRKYENWRELVLECKASGKPAKTWCMEQNIPYYTYHGWLKRAETQTVDVQVKRFAKVELQESNVSAQEIKLSCGKWTITLGRGFDAEQLIEVLRAVSRICS